MGYNKKNSFLQSFTIVGVFLLGMGLVFFTVGMVIQFANIRPENMSVYINGVRQTATMGSVRTFKLIFLLTFGLIGLGMAIGGAAVLGSAIKRRHTAMWLKAEGICVTAILTDYMHSNVSVNNRNLARLQCAYTAPDDTTYLFKSGHLRMDPYPYLVDGQVLVYYDPQNIGRYFVDVDGSVGFGKKLVEL